MASGCCSTTRTAASCSKPQHRPTRPTASSTPCSTIPAGQPPAPPGLRLAAARGVPGIADVDHAIEAEWLTPTLGSASHVVFSRDGLANCLGIDGLEAGIAEARRLVPGRLAVTLGGEGVVWQDGATLRRVPAFKVKAVDTLGAGDVFHGALTLALGERQSWEMALSFAAAAAAVKCSRPSGRGSFPTRQEVERLMEQGR